MFIALNIVLLIVSLMLHEIGHAVAMYRRGIGIKEVGLGFKFSKTLKWEFRPSFLPFPVVVTPFLIGAYVEPTEKGNEQIKKLSFKDETTIYTAGVVMNALIAVTIVLIAGLIQIDLLKIAIAIGAGLVVFLFRRWLGFIAPIIGVGALILVIMLMVDSLDNVGGPIAIVEYASEANGFIDMLGFVVSINISLALLNLMPISPLDGGKVVSAILRRTKLRGADEWVTIGGALIFLAFIAFLIIKDVIGLF